MANENRQRVQHIRSKQLTSGGAPKLPTPEQIGFGELAINFATDHETLSIKNFSGDIVTFSADHIFSGALADVQSDLAELSGSVVDNEEVVAAALTQLNNRANTIQSAMSEFSGSVIESEEAIAAAFAQIAGENDVISSALTELSASCVDNEAIIATALTQLDDDISAHTSNSGIHVTDSEKLIWNEVASAVSEHLQDENIHLSASDRIKLDSVEEKEKVIAQSIAVLGSRSDLVPMPSMTADSQTSSVTITVSGVQDTTHIITVPNNLEEFDLDVNNYGNLAVHKIIIDNTANEASDTTCQVNMGTYYFSGTNVVVGEEIYETLEVTSDILLVNSGESGNNVSVKPGKRMEIVLTPYMSGQTLETSFVVMANNGGNSGSGDGGSGTKIIMRNWSNE